MIVETGQGTVSDETGHFIFKEIQAGDYTLRVQMLGYTTEEIKVTVSNEYATDVHIALIEEGGNKFDLEASETDITKKPKHK